MRSRTAPPRSACGGSAAAWRPARSRRATPSAPPSRKTRNLYLSRRERLLEDPGVVLDGELADARLAQITAVPMLDHALQVGEARDQGVDHAVHVGAEGGVVLAEQIGH